MSLTWRESAVDPAHDPVLLDDWHPVALAASVGIGTTQAAELLGQEVVLWRGDDGVLHAWENRCPHRGVRLSIGEVVGSTLTCRYHGWRFGTGGICVHVPAQPDARLPGRGATTYAVREAYGLVWVCLGAPKADVPPFTEYADPVLRKVVCGPYRVACSGPRIVENFLDMAHFGSVHAGILGDAEHMAVHDYRVEAFDDGEGGKGIIALGCRAWQPQTNSLAHGGSDVEYTYRVVRPLTAILTKLPQAQSGFREAISLHIQPLAEEVSQVWVVLALTNDEQPEEALRAFQDRIFLQDLPILENQLPKRLPLAPRAEVSIACDRMSLAYRDYLRQSGLRFGLIRD
jgi:phenylpropionate dioxygenase-like ring-hydroxylating dioxygenase large terminal subunit